MPDFRRGGVNPLSYEGVRASTPPQMIVMQRDPTTSDFIGYTLGTFWMHWNTSDPTISSLWFLASVAENIGIWIPIKGGGGGTPVVVQTNITTPGSGMYTLNKNTRIVEVMGWGGGGGGTVKPSATALYPGGGSGSPFSYFKLPVSYLGGAGSTVNYTVGTGGIGNGNTAGFPGGNGGFTQFGNLYMQGGAGGQFQDPSSDNASGAIFNQRALGNTNNNVGSTNLVVSTVSGSNASGYAPMTMPGVNNPTLLQGNFSALPGSDSYSIQTNQGTSSAAAGGSVLFVGVSPMVTYFKGADIIDNNGNTILAGGSVSGGNGADNTNFMYFAGGSGGGAGTGSNNGGRGGSPGAGGGSSLMGTGGNGGNGALIIIEYLA